MNLLFAVALLGGWGAASCADNSKTAKEPAMNIQITSAAFSEGQPIPQKYTCQGSDFSPPLAWANMPPNTKSFALIADDPDAPVGLWTHWVLFNMPPDLGGLPEGVPTDAGLANGAIQGITSARRVGYHGPYPPSGTHRYYFKIYALDKILESREDISKEDLLDAMKGSVLSSAELMGLYNRGQKK